MGEMPKTHDSLDDILDQLTVDLTRKLDPNAATEEDTNDSTSVFGICVSCRKVVVGADCGCMVKGKLYHKLCFTCVMCPTLLSGTNAEVFDIDDQPHCKAHFLEKKAPKCSGCLGAIDGAMIELNGEKYHASCFACNRCKAPLDGKPFIPKEDGRLCQACYAKSIAVTCKRCSQPIIPEGPNCDVTCFHVGDDSYHVKCYACHTCDAKFTEDQAAFPVGTSLYCHPHAVEAMAKT